MYVKYIYFKKSLGRDGLMWRRKADRVCCIGPVRLHD